MLFSGHVPSDCVGEDYESNVVMLLRLVARWAFFAAATPAALWSRWRERGSVVAGRFW